MTKENKGAQFIEELKNDPETLAIGYLTESANSRIVKPNDVYVKKGASLDGKKLFLVVTRGMVIIKQAKEQQGL